MKADNAVTMGTNQQSTSSPSLFTTSVSNSCCSIQDSMNSPKVSSSVKTCPSTLLASSSSLTDFPNMSIAHVKHIKYFGYHNHKPHKAW